MVVAVDFDEADRPQLHGLEDLIAGLGQMRRAAALGADLHDAVVLAGGGQNRLALDHIHADRLLQIEVRIRLNRRDGRQRVPVIGRGDQHQFGLRLLQEVAVIAKGLGTLLRLLPLRHDLRSFAKHRLVDITQADNIHRRDLNQSQQVGLAIPTATNQRRPRRSSFVRTEQMRRERGQSQPSKSRLQKRATIHEQPF